MWRLIAKCDIAVFYTYLGIAYCEGKVSGKMIVHIARVWEPLCTYVLTNRLSSSLRCMLCSGHIEKNNNKDDHLVLPLTLSI